MMIDTSTNMKLSFINRSTQVSEVLPTCLVDAQSYTRQISETFDDILNQLETYKNTSFIDLDDVQLTDNKSLDHLIKESFTCSICRGLLVRARLLPCGHHFCRECLYYWFKIRYTCPLCRTYIRTNVSAIHVDNFLDELVDHGCNEELKCQRKQRKVEQASAILDCKYERSNSENLLRTVVESYVQTTAYVDSTQTNVRTNSS
ncbi:hypothetical protein MN116_007772 [Schistosoma mekongi]|uniref:RING-type domain-containing protein n=1 Tax=Schistosoma mekongi TaxID=38744 RepID=A0AAE2D2C5_SCHME|nr:hypothetical protein MN116_007772 [Schistosoma mekongi]